MKALVFHHPKKVKVEEVKDPNIEDDKDIIVKVTSTAICGSDLHIYNGFIPQAKDMVLGHEFMGIVEETGKGIKHLKKGDRVVVPFPIACGSCFFCKHALPTHCETSNDNYGPEGGMLKKAELFLAIPIFMAAIREGKRNMFECPMLILAQEKLKIT